MWLTISFFPLRPDLVSTVSARDKKKKATYLDSALARTTSHTCLAHAPNSSTPRFRLFARVSTALNRSCSASSCWPFRVSCPDRFVSQRGSFQGGRTMIPW